MKTENVTQEKRSTLSLSSNPHLRITKHHLGPISSWIGSQNTDLTLSIGAIIDAVNLLIIDVQVKGVPLRDDGQGVGLIQPTVNCWSHRIDERPGVRTIMEDEAVMPILTNSEAVEIVRCSIGTEGNSTTIPLHNSHLHFKSEIAEIICTGIARLRCRGLCYLNVISSSGELTTGAFVPLVALAVIL